MSIAVLVAALSATFATAPALGSSQEAIRETKTLQMMLRLNQLPPGFVFDENSFCADVRAEEIEGPEPGLAAYAGRYHPYTCSFEHERLYPVDGQEYDPAVVLASVIVNPSLAAVAAGRRAAPELLAYLTQDTGFHEVPTSARIGDGTRLFHTGLAQIRKRWHEPGSAIVWNAGTTTGVVFVAGEEFAELDRAATHFAELQQAHIAAPTPYLLSEGEDVPVFLSNPNLRVPVYWLGRTFKRPGQRTSFFISAHGRREMEGGLSGKQLEVAYAPYLFLDSWTRSGWQRFVQTRVGSRQWSWRCTRSRTVDLPNGHATIYASYRTGYPVCPKFPPHHFSAHVFLPGVVIAIGEAQCGTCQSGGSVYQSFRGMEAVVRGLRRWTGTEAERRR